MAYIKTIGRSEAEGVLAELYEELMGKDPAEQVRRDWKSARLIPEDRVLAEYAEVLTCKPQVKDSAPVETLRAAGFDDEAILTATEVVGYFNYINRMVSGLGAELEPEFNPLE